MNSHRTPNEIDRGEVSEYPPNLNIVIYDDDLRNVVQKLVMQLDEKKSIWYSCRTFFLTYSFEILNDIHA